MSNQKLSDKLIYEIYLRKDRAGYLEHIENSSAWEHIHALSDALFAMAGLAQDISEIAKDGVTLKELKEKNHRMSRANIAVHSIAESIIFRNVTAKELHDSIKDVIDCLKPEMFEKGNKYYIVPETIGIINEIIALTGEEAKFSRQ